MRLHGYWRSTASWRVRIGLALKGLEAEPVTHDLRTGEQHDPAYVALNPQAMVPALELDDGTVLTQSLAILEWLEETHPAPPLLPPDPATRAKVRAVAAVIACDIHPIQNLKILNRVRDLGGDPQSWARQIIADGLAACDTLISGQQGAFAFGTQPTLADILIVPQLGNARRFGVDLVWPRINEVEAACMELSAFQAAHPDNQPDAG